MIAEELNAVTDEPKLRISRGELLAPGSFPYQAGIVFKETKHVSCSGAIISATRIATAAECCIVHGRETRKPQDTAVLINAYHLDRDDGTKGRRLIPVQRIIIHPKYK